MNGRAGRLLRGKTASTLAIVGRFAGAAVGPWLVMAIINYADR